jgi:hypothetical protein
MALISPSEYERALHIVERFKAQQSTFKQLAEDAPKLFPVGTEVGSTKSLMTGVVYGYGSWRGVPLLKVHYPTHGDSFGSGTILVPNAYVIRSAE